MRLGIASFIREASSPDEVPMIDRFVEYGKAIEQLGFDGVWVGDEIGRDAPTLDPLLALSTLCAVTERVEFGTCIMQVPVRNAVDLAHRVQTLNVLAKGRFSFGVGVGSTRADFDIVGADFARRFSVMKESVDTMRRAWRGDPINGITLSPWKANRGGPPIMLGSWRSEQWIRYAAEHCEGWIASGLFSTWAQAEEGIRKYRAFGGKRAVLANVLVDPRNVPALQHKWAATAEISLSCAPDLARERLARIEQLGFDDVILLPVVETPAFLETVAELLKDWLAKAKPH